MRAYRQTDMHADRNSFHSGGEVIKGILKEGGKRLKCADRWLWDRPSCCCCWLAVQSVRRALPPNIRTTLRRMYAGRWSRSTPARLASLDPDNDQPHVSVCSTLHLMSIKTVWIIRPHHSNSQMRSIATDGVALSVCVSVCLLVTFVSAAKTAEPIEMPFWRTTWVGPRKPVVDRVQIPKKTGQFLGLSGPLKSIASHCCGVRSKNSIASSARLLQPTALLQTGLCHITCSPWKSRPCDAACRKNLLTTCCCYCYY